jgi:ubiquinol-cytochrome c reductase cytochrome b subunit
MKTWLLKIKWGANSMVALYLSVISGLVLALKFDPTEPFYSTGILELVVPFGAFWRSLHFFSSQIFFLLLIVHVVAILVERSVDPETAGGADVPATPEKDDRWLKLVLSLPVALLLLFTGYILGADATGESAGIIAENIILAIPVLGSWFNSFLFNISGAGMKVVHANHLIGLVVLWGYLVWDHLRKYRVSWRDNGLTVIVTLGISLLLKAPLETFSPGEFHISGPWFFIGLQELLRFIQPFWAGVVFPGLGLALLYLVVKDEDFRRGPALKGGIVWGIIITVATIIGLLR